MPDKATKQKRPTISNFVVETLSASPTLSNQALVDKVKKQFPWSAFQTSHATWYKYQIRKGRYQLLNGKKLPAKKSKAGKPKKTTKAAAK